MHCLRLRSLLRKEDGSFAPAYMLADSRMERAGRTTKNAPEQPLTHSLTRSAAIVVIGDEILAAKVRDVNTHFLCQELRAIGWRVCKVRLVSVFQGRISLCWALSKSLAVVCSIMQQLPGMQPGPLAQSALVSCCTLRLDAADADAAAVCSVSQKSQL